MISSEETNVYTGTAIPPKRQYRPAPRTKLLPLTVTAVAPEAGPIDGDTLYTLGLCLYWKKGPEDPTGAKSSPFNVTVIGTSRVVWLEATGDWQISVVDEMNLILFAGALPNLQSSFSVGNKFRPVIVTMVPPSWGPDEGLKARMWTCGT